MRRDKRALRREQGATRRTAWSPPQRAQAEGRARCLGEKEARSRGAASTGQLGATSLQQALSSADVRRRCDEEEERRRVAKIERGDRHLRALTALGRRSSWEQWLSCAVSLLVDRWESTLGRWLVRLRTRSTRMRGAR